MQTFEERKLGPNRKAAVLGATQSFQRVDLIGQLDLILSECTTTRGARHRSRDILAAIQMRHSELFAAEEIALTTQSGRDRSSRSRPRLKRTIPL